MTAISREAIEAAARAMANRRIAVDWRDFLNDAHAALTAALPVVAGWRTIGSAPKDIVITFDGSEYGEYILAYPVHGRVSRVRWWQSAYENNRNIGYQNFIADGGLACHPTHWKPLDPPPGAGER